MHDTYTEAFIGKEIHRSQNPSNSAVTIMYERVLSYLFIII